MGVCFRDQEVPAVGSRVVPETRVGVGEARNGRGHGAAGWEIRKTLLLF